jgi:hypothetical protein
MKAFQEFRLWSRQGPVPERAFTAVAAILAVGLLAWALVPASSNPLSAAANAGVAGRTSAQPTTTTTPGAVTPGSTVPAGSSSGSQASTGGVIGAAAPPDASGSSGGVATAPAVGGSSVTPTTPASPSCLSGSTTGISSTQIKVGVVVVNLGALNALLGVPSAQDEEAMYNAVFNLYNGFGGIQCRKVVPVYYGDNVLSASGEQALCLQIQQDGDFAVINNMYNPQEFNCLAQASVPNLFYTSPQTPAMQQFYPYVLSSTTDYDRLIKDYIFGAQQLGLLSGQKIGIIEQSCYPEQNTAITADLASIGISIASTFNYGCDTSSAEPDTPAQDLSAVEQFHSAGITTVLETARAIITDFATYAQLQNYHPKYVMMNDQSMALIADNSGAISPNFNGAIAITTDQEGGSNTPGYQPNAATTNCDKLASAAGQAPADDQHRLAGQLDGEACGQVAILAAAMQNMTALSRTALAGGLVKAGPLTLSYPDGPMDVTNAQDPTGGQQWRPAEWYTSCTCWKVTNLAWSDGWN